MMEARAGFLFASPSPSLCRTCRDKACLVSKQFCVHSFARGETRRALSLQHDTMTYPSKANGLMAFSVGHRPTCVWFVSLRRTCVETRPALSQNIHSFTQWMEARQALSLQHDTLPCPSKANGLMAFSVGHRPTCADTHPQSPFCVARLREWRNRATFADEKQNEENMAANALTPAQQHLLKLFSYNDSDEYALEIQEVLTRYFQERLDKEADRLWDEGILDQKRLDELRNEDLHKSRNGQVGA